MKRVHSMPFGASAAGEVSRFRLWAPGAGEVDLVLRTGDHAREQPMVALGDGWFEADAPDVGPGSRYGFRLPEGLMVPDPASRFNPDGVHALSELVDPRRYEWSDGSWRGRPWEEAVVYELHVGAFTGEGTFMAAIERLDDLVALGITAVELMPVASFPGSRGWGYDGVLHFAPHPSYGGPDDLKRLVDAAHARGLMILLDVVYNHFGPEGNYLHAYAPQFFNPGHRTPWGAAINFDAEGSRTVRDFFVHNALYWLTEFHFDGLRLDAVHAIVDDSTPHVVAELCATVRGRLGDDRHVHLVLENDANEARHLLRDRMLRPIHATAQWNDDIHHALHVLATGERDGYYADYAMQPVASFGRALAEGFVYQGDPSPYRGGEPRGEPSGALPSTAFVTFSQNHDQVGNRAFGERIVSIANPAALRALVACLLLAPSPPMLFMGEEFGASSPFLFFCDFGPELASAVTRGRREEFGRFARFEDPAARDAIPDPNAASTFVASKLAWGEAASEHGAEWQAFYRHCLSLRRRHIVPALAGMNSGGTCAIDGESQLRVRWTLGNGSTLHLLANLGDDRLTGVSIPPGMVVYASDEASSGASERSVAAWSVVLTLEQR